MINEDKKEKMTPSPLVGEGRGEGLKQQTLSRICKLAFGSLTNSTPVLKLLHAHRVSPKLLRNRRLNLFAIRINSLSLNHPSAIPLSQRERVCRKAAFTLAEVLITLGIIGVVAAMTLPALVQHYRKVEYSSRLKKFYSSMNQAILLSQVQNGSPSEWNKVGTIYDNEGKIDGNANNEFASSFFLKYLGPYMKYTKIERGKVYFADGSTALMWNGGCIDFNFDVNGDSKPNQAGRDVFVFILCSTEDELWGCGKQKYFCSYYGGRSLSRTTMLDNCKNNPGVCSGLLIQDGLEFKKDYPYKL